MELYHVLNRGVEGRDLFLDSQDYVRFIHNLYQFNDRSPAPQSDRRNVGFTKPNIAVFFATADVGTLFPEPRGNAQPPLCSTD